MTRFRGIPDLGPLEYQLLRLLWKQAPASARDILDNYNQKARRPLAYTTVMTLLTRMAEKGVLDVDRSRQPYAFEPRVSREQIQKQRIHDFVDRFFEGSAVDLAVSLVQEGDFSEESIQRLESLLRQKSSQSKKREVE